MNTTLIDRIAQAYALGYGQYLKALVAAISDAIADPNALEPRIASNLAASTMAAAGAFFEEHRIYVDGMSVMEGAITAAGDLKNQVNRDSIAEHCWSIWVSTQDALSAIAMKDKIDGRTLFRRFAFDASLRVDSLGRTGALIAARLKHTPVSPIFMSEDRAGRKRMSQLYVRTLVRGALVSTYVDAFLFTLSANGVSKARVVYDDPEHENNGLVFSIDGTDTTIPSFEDIRTKVFHPNTTARIEPVKE